MPVTLLSLPNGNSSLEFASDEIEAVRQAILDLFGEAASEPHVTYSALAFGGEKFLFQNEWDDPCLIASTEEGSHLLLQIEQRLLEKTP
ncbi:hypothetical protein HNO88_002394 [Novosphingobium chloroacetimidivorans]|uniref:Uncharacterized protein n=1 Tax=Novosphingobium chloroacetimidivorans TaxID=1428314 RepID=A0A7W7KBN8_9SPHN|nr:hypothetical protein [Novosphingobium chloroacetimidivorans]MBB4859068.1 hypothetical protein [Novosphingobium chloroacetimidivorans]